MAEADTEILKYEAQLAQVRLAGATLSEGPEKEKLDALEADLLELISLSKRSLEALPDTLKDNFFSKEYNLFKTEIDELKLVNAEKLQESDSQISSKTLSNDLKEEFESLQGAKCQAPFTYKWTNDVTYYNAFISHVPEANMINGYENIKVKVMFTNPTHKEMLPCPYYLEGKCRFSDDKCRYSHGEVVLLDSLKEYRDPDFSKLSRGCKVLAKQNDELWRRATVLNVNETHCSVKFELNSKEEEILFHNILPLDYCESCDGDISSDDNNDTVTLASEENDEDVVRRIINTPGSTLGEWEKFTKGFGSRIMARMGYIYGSGLGKHSMGRVEPISAVILPAGKSLDHCMMLKEKSGNKDLFKAEKQLKKLQKKHEEKLKNAYDAEKEKTDVFTFLNATLHPSKLSKASKVKTKNEFKNETTRNLNVTGLQIAEELKRVQKEIKLLNQSLARHSPDTHTFNIIKEKLEVKKIKLLQLHASEQKVMIEQNTRKDRQKLTQF